MAAGAKCRMRMWGGNLYTDIGVTVSSNTISGTQRKLIEEARKVSQLGKTVYGFSVNTQQANAAVAEISPPNAVLNEPTTRVLLHVKSGSADDTDAADKDVRAIRIIGITSAAAATGALEYTIEEIRMNGQTGVATTRYYARVMHSYACEWGSGGGDAAGAIIVTNVAEAVTYLTIQATFNESDGSAIYVMDGKLAIVYNAEAIQTTRGAAGRGTLHEIRFGNFDGDGADPDYNSIRFTSSYEFPHILHPDNVEHVPNDDTADVQFWQTQIGGAESFDFKAQMMVYDK